MAKITKTFIACDNPKCSVSTEDDGEPAMGIYINSGSVHHGGGGGPVAKVYACSEGCLGPAVMAVFDEAWDTGKVRKKW